MRKFVLLFLLSATVFGGATERYLELGEKRMAKAHKAKKNATRLSHIRAAQYFFKRAKKAGEAGLVSSLNLETRIYYDRKSLPLATKRNAAALKLAPKDKTALDLKEKIAKARDKDIYDKDTGNTAIQRIRNRRIRNGVPLRNRGRARRR